MDVFTSVADIPAEFGPSAIAIGKFDGVHAGHREVLGELVTVARERGLVAAAVTFDRNPLTVLHPELHPVALTSNAQKIESLAGIGLDATVMLTFDNELSAMSAQDFVREILADTLHARVVMVGADFRFGAGGAGDVATLRELGPDLGIEIDVVDDVVVDAEGEGAHRASSTWIRELLAQGKPAEAATLLGRLHGIRSIVVRGQARGRELGYPTANLAPATLEGFIPADGVYAAWLTVDGERYGAAVSIGNNPTFDGIPDKQVEAHVLDETLDLYDKTVELQFVDYVRPMLKFDGIDALVAQMTDDEARVRDILGYAPKSSEPVRP